MKKIFLAAAIIAATMSSCSQNEIEGASASSMGSAVGFSVYTGISTKADVVTSVEDAAGFGVFGYYTIDAFSSTADTANFIYNSNVIYDNSAWTYSPVKYWSEHETDLYSFFGYAPFTGNTGSAGSAATSTTDYATISVDTSFGNDVASTPVLLVDFTNGSCDFVAGQDIDVVSGKEDNVATGVDAADEVALVLLHETTRVTFEAITDVKTVSAGVKDEDDTYVVVKSLDLAGTTFYNKGTYTFDDADSYIAGTPVTTNRGTWDFTNQTASSFDINASLNLGTGTDYKDIATAGTTKGATVQNGQANPTTLFATDSYEFLLPPAGTTGTAADGDVKLTITYDIVTVDAGLELGYAVSENNTKTVSLAAGSFKQGTAYSYLITFGMNEVVVTATVDPWATATAGGSINIDEY